MVSRQQLLLTLFILPLTIHVSSTTTHQHLHRHRRRLLHQPLFPLDSPPPSHPPTLSPQTQPQKQQPKLPFSSASSSSTPQKPFFPFYHSAPTPPAPTAIATFPANISSLLLPQTTSKPHHHVLGISLAVSFLSVALIAGLVGFLYYRKNPKLSPISKPTGPDCLRLYPPNIATSDGSGGHKPPPHTTSNTSAEFLYFGTLANSREIGEEETAGNSSNAALSAEISTSSPHQKIGSPELKPLPPLPRHNFVQDYRNVKQEEDDEEEEEEFFSPRGSSGRQENLIHNGSSSCRMYQSVEADHFGNRSFNSRSPSPSYRLRTNSVSPSITVSNSPSPPSILSPVSLKSKSPDSLISFPLPLRPLPPRPVIPSSPPLSSTNHSPSRNSDVSDLKTESPTVPNHFVPLRIPPPPPPPPPAGYWEVPAQVPAHSSSGPPVLTRPALFKSAEQLPSNVMIEKNEETPKPKLKPLHWDKVRASSDRAMVWDQIKSSSFQLDEEMIESLFTANNLNSSMKENGGRRQILPLPIQENRVLDPKKSQNIAILLRALNVTIDEVCEALLEGNPDTMGTELLESLLKMAPTKEEEWKLKEFKDESPFKLGPAEKFLKAVLDVPFAFKRIDAMLYIVNFDSEIEYLKRSFETLQMACDELKNSRMFLKLLEAVLKAGNRMNVGTNRGDAHAFKLDTLLKLVDVKGTDGKTTLLHFVVQEIIRVEGSKLSNPNNQISTGETTSLTDDVEFRKLGLQVVSSLSGELLNVKKAAAMDSDVLSSEAGKLADGIKKIYEVVKMNVEIGSKESKLKFSENMNAFLKRGEEDIVRIQAQESVALSMVKEITEYFHGNSAKEEAHPFRIFMVVRDFLSVLDQVCKEVGRINERSMAGSTKQFSVLPSSNPVLQPVFPGFMTGKPNYDSSDDETSSLSSQ